MSLTPPAGNGTTKRTDRDGQVCALATRDKAGSAAAPAARCRNCRRGSFTVPSLFRFDVGRPDDLAPLLGFFGDEPAKIAGRAGKRSAAEISEPSFQFGIGQRSID